MWNKRAPLLLVRLNIRVKGKPRLWLFLPVALYVPQQLLLAWEGLLALLPGSFGSWLRRAVDTLHRLLVELMAAEPQRIADVNLTHGLQRVRVLVRTWGIFTGGDGL